MYCRAQTTFDRRKNGGATVFSIIILKFCFLLNFLSMLQSIPHYVPHHKITPDSNSELKFRSIAANSRFEPNPDLLISCCACSQHEFLRTCAFFGVASRRENRPFKQISARDAARIYRSRDEAAIRLSRLKGRYGLLKCRRSENLGASSWIARAGHFPCSTKKRISLGTDRHRQF